MGQRLDLQTLLEGIVSNVYFQPPASVTMVYPCIVYERDYVQTQFADNFPYRLAKRYQITYISRNPDDPVPDQIAELPSCTFERAFTASNLHHDVYTLFF